MELAGLGIDAYFYVVSFAEIILAGLDQRLLDGFQQRVFADVFLFFQQGQRLQQFVIHFENSSLTQKSKACRISAISVLANFISVSSNSMVTDS